MTRPSDPKPLTGWRVLVPRGGEWGNGIAATLRQSGATPVIAPMINFAATENAGELANAFDRLQSGAFDWLVVTSATTVDVLVSHQVTVPGTTKIAAVGETTGSALTVAGYPVNFAPEGDTSALGFIAQWPVADPTGRALVPQSDTPEEDLGPGLGRLGFAVEFVTAYRTVGVQVSGEIASDIASGRIGAVLITSGSVAKQVSRQFAPLPPQTVVAAIGPRTALDAKTAGITVSVVAASRSAGALVEALVAHVAGLEP